MDSFGTEFRYRQPETGQLQGGLVPVDFATIAAGYGCKTWRVTTLDELRHALDAARRETVSTLIDIKSAAEDHGAQIRQLVERRSRPDGALRADSQGGAND